MEIKALPRKTPLYIIGVLIVGFVLSVVIPVLPKPIDKVFAIIALVDHQILFA